MYDDGYGYGYGDDGLGILPAVAAGVPVAGKVFGGIKGLFGGAGAGRQTTWQQPCAGGEMVEPAARALAANPSLLSTAQAHISIGYGRGDIGSELRTIDLSNPRNVALALAYIHGGGHDCKRAKPSDSAEGKAWEAKADQLLMQAAQAGQAMPPPGAAVAPVFAGVGLPTGISPILIGAGLLALAMLARRS